MKKRSDLFFKTNYFHNEKEGKKLERNNTGTQGRGEGGGYATTDCAM